MITATNESTPLLGTAINRVFSSPLGVRVPTNRTYGGLILIFRKSELCVLFQPPERWKKERKRRNKFTEQELPHYYYDVKRDDKKQNHPNKKHECHSITGFT
jgi:hypothetical protein